MRIMRSRFLGHIWIAAAFGFAGCASAPPVKEYVPMPATAPSAGAATLKAAVALAENLSRTPSESEMTTRLADILHGRVVNSVTRCMLFPEQLTEMLIKDLKATGHFASVHDEGAGPADVLVKPIIKTCVFTIVGFNVDNVHDVELQVQVLKRGRKVMDKTYADRGHPVDMGNIFNVLSQERFPPLLKQIRDDVVASLEN